MKHKGYKFLLPLLVIFTLLVIGTVYLAIYNKNRKEKIEEIWSALENNRQDNTSVKE